MSESDTDLLALQIKKELYEYIGTLLFGKRLYSALGYPSVDAFRQSVSRKTVPVEVFSLEYRRGRFALSRDVAEWLATQRQDIIKKRMKEVMHSDNLRGS